MNAVTLLSSAMQLAPQERFDLADHLLQSLDIPDASIDALWLEEAKKRLAAYRSGLVKGIPAEEVVGAF